MNIVNRKILLTGKNGQVGWELQRALAVLGEVIALGREEMDLADPDSIRKVIREVKPNMIVNAAAYTAVDKAESEPELAMTINGAAPGIMAEEAKKLNAAIIHYSTDYVFDGTKVDAYTEDDAPNPLSVYGKTKLAGDENVASAGAAYLIFRTQWVYGLRGRNFLRTILDLAREKDKIEIVADQYGAPTWSRLVAEATAQVIARISGTAGMRHMDGLQHASGIYNLTAPGRTSWFGFAERIGHGMANGDPVDARRMIQACEILPIASEERPSMARRPKNSTLLNDKIRNELGIAMPNWQDGLRLSLDEGKFR